MDVVLSKTIQGLSDYAKELQPDMIVVHGDRVEAMAGAIVGSLNNILVVTLKVARYQERLMSLFVILFQKCPTFICIKRGS
ncbi:UDP-N-acetylglucosamine 2-epimerase [Vibrio sp. M60_M31a]